MAGYGSTVKNVVRESNIGNIVWRSFLWLIGTILTNSLAMMVVLLALYGRPDPSKSILARTNEYFFASGAAAMVSIGLAAGAITDLVIKSNGGKQCIVIALGGLVAMVLAPVFYGGIILGGNAIPNAKEVSVWMMVAGLVFGVTVQITTVRRKR